MKKPTLCALLLALLLCLPGLPALAASLHTRDEVREMYKSIGAAPDESPYLAAPSPASPYDTGALTDAALADACNYLNFLRWLAYLNAPVRLDGELNGICQHGAVLLAALDRVDHAPERPADMGGEFYRAAAYAAASSNLAGLNWMKDDILRSALNYFARDDGEKNLPQLGHRRWLLNPSMGATGFGLANSATGMTYALMFAHDLNGEAGEWSEICWPARGAFPAELMRAELAWSVTLNPAIYDLNASQPQVTMRERLSGAEYCFPYPAGAYEDGYFTLNSEAYGSGPCLIFRPDIKKAELEEYQQNQIWEVEITGLVDWAGNARELRYETQMIALHAIDAASVELDITELALDRGGTAQLRAAVIPGYADDVSVSWTSTDEAVAVVDEQGNVTAVSPGACEIVAVNSAGREDRCRVTVGE